MIPRQTVEQIIDAARIEDVVGDFVTLKRRGSGYIACCPFHSEKTPSFVVTPAKGIYKCFGCGKGGDAVHFVMEHENKTYAEALKYLAAKYHIEVVEKEETAEDIAARQRGESLLLVSEFAQKFFQQQLKTNEGQVGYAYFKSRGLSDETIEKFGLGWAPAGRDKLQQAARAAGFKEEYLVDTGLCFKTEQGKVMDRFYDRVAFPIHNINGRVIAFGCRTLRSDKEVAKYVNSNETEIYQKRKTLYGMFQARQQVHREDKFILVEGYLDVITMHQLGITNVAASSGTSLTEEQVKLIKRFTDNVTIIYDGDSAGIHAALRGIGLVLQGGLNVKVVLLPDGDDPDSFGRKHTKEEVLDFIKNNEQDFIGFKTKLLLADAAGDPIKKAELINDIADTIALIPDPVKRSVYVPFAAGELEVNEQLLFDRIKRTRTRMLEDRRKEQERQQEREQEQAGQQQAGQQFGGYGGGSWDVPWPDASQDNGPSGGLYSGGSYSAVRAQVPQEGIDSALLPCENELLAFILRSGRTPLKFDENSQYFTPGEPLTVAEFIDAVLSDDDIQFSNVPLRKTYAKYFELYAKGLAQEQISVRLLSDEDPSIQSTAQDLIVDKHLLTVERFESSLTKEITQLINFVPKALMAYNKARVEKKLNELSRRLVSPHEDAEALLKEINELTKLKNTLTKALGRV